MFSHLPELKLKNRKISLEECEQILKKTEYMTLATVDEKGMPYAVPLSFVYYGGKVYFHTGKVIYCTPLTKA